VDLGRGGKKNQGKQLTGCKHDTSHEWRGKSEGGRERKGRKGACGRRKYKRRVPTGAPRSSTVAARKKEQKYLFREIQRKGAKGKGKKRGFLSHHRKKKERRTAEEAKQLFY